MNPEANRPQIYMAVRMDFLKFVKTQYADHSSGRELYRSYLAWLQWNNRKLYERIARQQKEYLLLFADDLRNKTVRYWPRKPVDLEAFREYTQSVII